MSALADKDVGEEFEFYRDQEHLQPQGPPVRRESGLSEMLPVRLSPALLGSLRERAQGDQRSVSWVVRRAIERHLGASEDVGWLLPEAVLDPVYRPIREGAEALRILGDALRALMAEPMEPAPDSIAAREMEREPELAGQWSPRPVLEVVQDARLKLAYAIEHLDAIRRLSSPPVLFFSAALIARSVIEGAVRTWWLLDPAIDARARVARGMTERLYGLRQKLTVAKSFTVASSPERSAAVDEVDDAIEHIVVTAEMLAFGVRRDKRGRPTAIEEGRPDATRLVAELFASHTKTAVVSMTYRLWSAISHGTGWETDSFSVTEPGPREEYETVSLVARPEHLNILMHATCIATIDAADRLVFYMNASRSNRWAQARSAVMATLSNL